MSDDDDKRTDYKYPKSLKLCIAVFYLENYGKGDDQGTIAKAKEMLAEHNIALEVWPDKGKKLLTNTIPFKKPLVQDTDYVPIRKQINEIISANYHGAVKPLPALYCQFASGGYGTTTYLNQGLVPMVLVSIAVNNDKVTLLHEMGHATPKIGKDHVTDDPDPNNRNMMHESEPRTTIYKSQVEAFAGAWFAIGS
jgi:hypothetical protein